MNMITIILISIFLWQFTIENRLPEKPADSEIQCEFTEELNSTELWAFCDYQTDKIGYVGRKNVYGQPMKIYDISCRRNWDCHANGICVNLVKGRVCMKHPKFKLVDEAASLKDSKKETAKSGTNDTSNDKKIIRHIKRARETFYTKIMGCILVLLIIFI
ncbi:unnamed protein product [Caenorhabditis angaria]|uniref:Domain of unknown function DX domain-containing protein n=1 Tax=Caenorhabditis angaria TaxID=860376 RepID=A0A9P1MV93_9PELO|nr:unnamed protein product [Caenorhabditis angaria]